MRVEPIRVVSCLTPCSVRQLPSGAAVADFGQNLAGVVQLRMHGLTPGTCVTLRFSEVITPDGELNTENLRTAQQCDVYLARGGEETYCPRFTYHGFRYAEISGLPDPLAAEDVCALVLRSDVASRALTLVSRSSTTFSASAVGQRATICTVSRPTARSATSASAG